MKFMLLIALGFFALPAWAQSSANFTVTSNAFNNGGTPSNGLPSTSANYRVGIAAIGEALSTMTPSSASFSMRIGFVAFNVANNRRSTVIFRHGFEGADTSPRTSPTTTSSVFGTADADLDLSSHEPKVLAHLGAGVRGSQLAGLPARDLLLNDQSQKLRTSYRR